MTSITLSEVTFSYPSSGPLFSNLNLHVAANASGRIVSVVGPSGCGKTTLLRLVAGIQEPSAGEVRVSPANATVGLIEQEPVFFEHLGVRANAELMSAVGSRRDSFDASLFRRVAFELELERVLGRDGPPSSLSGGERQRLSLLREMAVGPELLLMDEPCTGLDPVVRTNFLSLVRHLADEHGLLVLYVTHHLDEARAIGDELVFLDNSGPTTTATVLPIAEALNEPTSLAMARHLLGDTANESSAEVSEGELRIGGSSAALADTDLSPEGEFHVMFPFSTVRWSACGVPVTPHGTSAGRRSCQYKLKGESRVVIGPAATEPPQYFLLHGDALMYGAKGELLGRLKLRSGL